MTFRHIRDMASELCAALSHWLGDLLKPQSVIVRAIWISCLIGLGGVLAIATTRMPLQAGAEQGSLAYAGPSEGDYKLGPRDRIRIQVFEWRPASDEIYAWEALNAEYSVDVSGRLALPLVGQIPAEGMTTGELAATISASLQRRMGTVTAPDTTVEIIEFRPFYIAGDIQTPGEYAYRPGLSVLQAVSLGGGLQRTSAADTARFARDIVQLQGDLSLMQQDRATLMIRHARLVAEMEDRAEIALPVGLDMDSAEIQEIIRNEKLLFTTRRASFRKQLRSLTELKKHLEAETASLTAQITTHDGRVQLLEQELSGINKLAQKGLVTAPRLLGLRRNLAQLQGEGLRLEARLSQVRQDMTRNQVTRLDLQNRRAEELTRLLQDTTTELEKIGRRAQTGVRLIDQARVGLASEAGAGAANDRPVAKYAIVRRFDTKVVEIDATEHTALMPGDTLKVELELPEANGAGSREYFGTSTPRSDGLPPAQLVPLRQPILYFEEENEQLPETKQVVPEPALVRELPPAKTLREVLARQNNDLPEKNPRRLVMDRTRG